LAEAVLSSESLVRGHGGEFSVQLLVACSPRTIEKAIQNDPSPDLFVLPATVSGKSCHRLMRGLFKTSGEATQMVSSLPAYYVSEGARPRAVPLKTLVR
jgi:septal ring-binding cell division protein DamX